VSLLSPLMCAGLAQDICHRRRQILTGCGRMSR
jgi:hypothetical protein